mgnify:CR=1 FL=1
MDDIIKLIRDAESEALKIKEEAATRAVYIAENAEVEANKILKICDEKCAVLRETEINRAEKEGASEYNNAIQSEKQSSRAYADEILKKNVGAADEIVRRVLSGSR